MRRNKEKEVKTTPVPVSPVSPDAQKLIAWANNVMTDDWGDAEVPAWVVNLAQEVGIDADVTSERAMANLILGALRGAR